MLVQNQVLCVTTKARLVPCVRDAPAHTAEAVQMEGEDGVACASGSSDVRESVLQRGHGNKVMMINSGW